MDTKVDGGLDHSNSQWSQVAELSGPEHKHWNDNVWAPENTAAPSLQLHTDPS